MCPAFDHDYHELYSYPKHHCKFCSKMKSQKDTRILCDESDRASFMICQQKSELILYHSGRYGRTDKCPQRKCTPHLVLPGRNSRICYRYTAQIKCTDKGYCQDHGSLYLLCSFEKCHLLRPRNQQNKAVSIR